MNKKAPKMKVVKRRDTYWDDRPSLTIRESMMPEIKNMKLGDKMTFCIEVEVKELSMRDVQRSESSMKVSDGPSKTQVPKQERTADIRIIKIGLDNDNDE